MIRISILSVLLLFGPTPFLASEAAKPSASEVLQLPRYCWGEYNPAMKDPAKVIDSCGLNHYCPGVLEFNRSYSAQSKSRKYQHLVVALRGIEYGLGGMHPGCSIKEDVFLMYSRVRNAFTGVGKPVPPDRFSGQLAKPAKPYSSGESSTNAVEKTREETKTAAELTQDRITKPGEQDTNSPQAMGDNNLTESTSPSKNVLTLEPPKIGSPTNPYCRFCPD